MIFLFGCLSSHQTLRTFIPPQRIEASIETIEIPLRYQEAQIRSLTKKEIKNFGSPRKDQQIWTQSPSPRPYYLQKPHTYDVSHPIIENTQLTPTQKEIVLLDIEPQRDEPIIATGSDAIISGPLERISSEIVILAQLNNSDGGDTVQWDTTISPAPCPVEIPGFVCTPPAYVIQYRSEHSSTLDAFSYTQLKFKTTNFPVPVYLRSRIKNTKKESMHQTVIHPASIYVGLSAPYWSELNHILLVQGKIVQTDGTDEEAEDISISMIGSSSIQTCSSLSCSFTPDRTGWHQIIATATDNRGKISQSNTFVFIYGKSFLETSEILIHPQRKALLIQGSKNHTDLMLGYLAKDEIFLDSYPMSKGFLIQKTQEPIKQAKALLIGEEKTELTLSLSKPKETEKTFSNDSYDSFFEDIQTAHLQNLWLHDRSSVRILLPPGPPFQLAISSKKNKLTFDEPWLQIEERRVPSMLLIPFSAEKFGTDTLILRTNELKKELPVTIRASLSQRPKIQHGVLKIRNNSVGAKLTIPAGHFSLGTDTHAEHRLLEHVLPYLDKVPTIKNRMQRIQVVSQSWDALFHSGESYAWSLLEQSKADIAYLQENWNTLNDDQLLNWLYTMVVMNQSSLYVPTQHIIDVYEEIKQNKYTPPQRSFLFFTLASAQRLPLKGILSMPPRSKIKKLFSELQDKDRIWLIPALEKDNPTRHWTYSNYEQLQEESPERIMLAFFRMREYRYRIKNLRKVTSFDTHEGILAQLIHARDRRLNRYSIHAFLWENNRILERGGHRRRAHHPIERQEKSKTKRELTLTAKGEGTLRYTLSWRPPNMSSPVLGSFVKQHISKEGDKQFLNIEFDVPKKGIIWIHDQLPSPVQLLTFQASWIEEIQIQNQELFIKTKELTPGRHHIKIPIYTLHKGSYQDPPVRVGQGSSWFAQSESAQLIIK